MKNLNLKHTIADEAGTLVELNMSYPQLSGLDDAYLQKCFNDYYSAIAEGLHRFTERTLAVHAAKSRTKNGADFKKWGMVGKFTHIVTGNTLQIRLKVWIFKDGERREKILAKDWVRTDSLPLLHRLANKELAGS
ncbi:MAG: hypothetical protein AB9835_05305 [Eubacteriales bacterium]